MLDKIVDHLSTETTNLVSKKILDTTKEIAKPLIEQVKFVSSPNFPSINAWGLSGHFDALHGYPRRLDIENQQDFAMYTQGYIDGEKERKKDERLDGLFNVAKIIGIGAGVTFSIVGIIKFFGLFEDKKGGRKR